MTRDAPKNDGFQTARRWNIQIRQLHYFIVVAEEGNLAKASERLNMAKSPLGRQIRQMEAILGATLFTRSQTGMTLTLSGQELLSDAYRILESCWLAEEKVAKTANGVSGIVDIGFSDDFMFSELGSAINQFKREYPNVVVSANLANSHEVIESLRLGKLQVGLLNYPLPANAPELASNMLPSAPLYIAVSMKHPLARRKTASLSEFKDSVFITGNIVPHNAFYLQAVTLLRRAKISPEFMSNIWPKEFQLDLVSSGAGVTLLTCPKSRPMRPDIALLRLKDSGASIKRCIV
ncbi:MAG: LysR family transcriptional regulator [Pseudomonadota bacterium]